MATLTATKANLQRLAVMRLVIVCALVVALLYAAGWLQVELAWGPLLTVVALLASAALFTFWRLGQRWPATNAELFSQLLFDVLALSGLLYLSGGATNPFVSWYLVPLAIAAVLLPRRYCVALALICLGLYSVLLFIYQPLPLFEPAVDQSHHHQANELSALNLHIVGMWFNFALSAALITYVVVRMASALREQETELRRRREQALHQEQLLAVATLAAGTAHELGTPLSTMTVLLDEMHSDDPQLNDDIALLRRQVGSCRTTLKQLVETARAHQQPQSTPLPVTTALQQVLERWQLLRPQAQYTLQIDGAGAAPLLAYDTALQQAIINLLDNGMDAGGPLAMTLDWHEPAGGGDGNIELRIRDRGPGVPLELAEQLGSPFVTSKGKGLGLGLYLSHATAERCGGSIHLYNHAEGGTEVVLRLPIVRGEQP